MVPSRVIERASRCAALSVHRFRVGAVVYKRGSWSAGFNKANKTHPRSPHPYKSIHAEFAAVLGAVAMEGVQFGWDLTGYSIYVHRLKRDGSAGLAKPCEWCQKMLAQVGIKEISYSNG